MADSRLSQLTAKTSPASADLIFVTDVSDVTQSAQGTSKSITVGNLNTSLAALSKTLTNTTFDSGGTGNTFKIGGTAVTGVTGTGNAVLATSPQFTSLVGIGTPANASIALVVNTGNDTHEGIVIFANSGTQSASLLDIQNSSFVSKFTVDKSGNTVVSGTINKITLTQPATAATLTLINNTTVTGPASTDTLVGRATTDTLTNKRNTKRTVATTQSATPTINTDNTDVAYITALAQAITSMTTNLSGTPNANDALIISITDNGTARAITWGASFESSGNAILPTTTVISTRLDVGFLWNVATSKWRCVAVA